CSLLWTGPSERMHTFLRFCCMWFSRVFHNAGFSDLWRCSWEEIATIFMDLVVRNRRLQGLNLDRGQLRPPPGAKAGLLRRFNQLPCSLYTLRRREEIIA